MKLFIATGDGGFEPPNPGVKVLCLDPLDESPKLKALFCLAVNCDYCDPTIVIELL